MKNLYAPWRGNYVVKKARIKSDDIQKDECVFCKNFADSDDAKNYVLKRFKHNAIVMNLYPYNTGHLMVIPFAHQASPSLISKEARDELMELTTQSAKILEKELGAEGINLGMNLGRPAGAGIPTHIHMHVLPRWIGDTNFMPLLADTKPISLDLNMVYKDLKPLFDKIKI
jgi:ATP adenylyltransferase